MNKRVIFPKGKQKEFLINARKELQITWPEFARKIGTKRKTLEKAYRYEYCSLPLKVLIDITKLRRIKKEKLLIKYQAKVVDFIPDATKLSRLGEKRTKLKEVKIEYTKRIPLIDPTNIKISWCDKKKDITFPKKLTSELAEEIGIHIGDGFLSAKKHDYRVKGNKDEKEYYDEFIKKLYKKLFNINLNIKEYEETYGFELYSQGIWMFKTKALGIEAGRKNDMNFPEIIKVNNQEILCAFIRGIFDTDGCLDFKSQNGRMYYYPSISISLCSENMIKGIAEILSMLGLEPYIGLDREYWRIILYGYGRLEKYYNLIGWHNPKHLRKLKEWKITYPKLAKDINI